jgi:hypothetical protein
VVFDDHELETAAAVRAEWRAEEEAWTRAAYQRWEHSRTLADVARDCMHCGDRATFSFASVMFTGAIIAVGTDLVRVATVEGAVDVSLDAGSELVLRISSGRDGGTRGDGTVTTFAARLRELEGTRVELGVTGNDGLRGELHLGRGQVSLVGDDGGRAYLPTGSVAWVRPVDVD